MRRMIPLITLVMLFASAVIVVGQASSPSDYQPGLNITVSNKTCSLVIVPDTAATPEATVEAISATETVSAPTYPVLTLGDGCYEVTPLLTVPSNDVIWIGFSIPNEPAKQRFEALPGDDHPPKFDKRGRFVGCTIPLTGEQLCRALWENAGTTYLIEIPITVRGAYIIPATEVISTAASPVSTPVPVSTPNAGIWGTCGSCTTCGGPIEQCVQAPDNTCVWDAFRCERPNPK